MVLRHNYTRNHKTAKAGLRYYQMRPRGEDEPARSIFTRDWSVARDDAYRMMEEHQPERGFLVHRIVLAPSDDERPEDLREMTRQMMRELEQEREQDLHWVAIEHRHTEHHHVHVMLFGGTDAPDGRREVRLGREDHSLMKEEAASYCREEAREREEWGRLLERADEMGREAEPAWMPHDDAPVLVPDRGENRDDWDRDDGIDFV